MKRGDIFVLGEKKYQFLFSRGMKAFVRANVSKNPTIPSWFSEMLPLHFDVACALGRFRKLVKERLDDKKDCVQFIREYTYCSQRVAEELYAYLREQQSFSEIPDEGLLVVEQFKEEKEFLLFHIIFCKKINNA